ncbi:styrene monooxygenase/indole monooxygenase family protein [Polyangium spumosum]|uniref:Monooxygenase n=1 Tax=Polyangium spumosum TaxID=889282 RepID=A0A6N7PXL9_9BACT|nr:styrene monooxygenase/indole monooxygenase family protein [Polyangium spumosum]MRG96267.1 monooxygenase [Polyangium spumosum]
MSSIGIVGAGIAGLQLGLYLRSRGISCTLYTDRSGDEIRSSRLPSTAALLGSTRARDRELGIRHWDDAAFGCFHVDVRVKGLPELSLRGRVDPPALFIDMRLYLPRLLEDFEARGGPVVRSGALGPAEVARLGDVHDLVVVATGRGELGAMFPRDLDRSPWLEPQRRLFAGLFRGINFPDELGLLFQIIPGQGEIFESQLLTADGPVSCLLFEAIPESSLDAVTRVPCDDDPGVVEGLVLDLLEAHAPTVHARVDRSSFQLTGALDWMQAAIVPTARRAYVALGEGRFAVAVGDTFATHDPVLWQGANAASRGARALGEAIVQALAEGRPLDHAFCAGVDERLWSLVGPSMQWTNAFLSPPPPHAMAIFCAASRDQGIADAFASNFDDPALQWRIFRGPEGASAFLEGFRGARPSRARGATSQAPASA